MFGRSETIGNEILEYKESVDYLKTCMPELVKDLGELPFNEVLENLSIHKAVLKEFEYLVKKLYG